MTPTRRTVVSATIAAALFAASIVMLALFLNPRISAAGEARALFLALFVPYAGLGTLVLWTLAGLARLLGAPRPARPPLDALPWFTSLTSTALAASCALYWSNLVAYRHSVPLEVLPALTGAAVALSLSLLVLVIVMVDVLLFPSRGRGVSAALVVLAAASAVVLPMAMRPVPVLRRVPVPVSVEAAPPARRVILVGIDGLGPAALAEVAASGAVPGLAQMLRGGAHGPLATLRPTEGPPLWTTVFTGTLPRDHGVKSFTTYRLRGSGAVYELLPKGAFIGLLERAGFVEAAPVTAGSRRRPAVWNALNAFGLEAGVVRFWGTHPPERVRGFMLSNYFHVLADDPRRAASALHPPDLGPEVGARVVRPAEIDAALLSEFVDLSVPEGAEDVPWRRELLERALAPDLTYQRAGEVLRAAYDPPFFATYFYGLDRVGHAFTRYAQPERFGDVRSEERRRYGAVVDRYTAFLGRVVAAMAEARRPGEVLIVISTHGMSPVPTWRRAWEAVTGDPWLSGMHSDAPDGVILAVGDGIRPGARMEGASVLDVAPTILYLMGLPVGRDMEGRVLGEMIDASFAAAHPVTFIPSYESLAVQPAEEFLRDLPPLPVE